MTHAMVISAVHLDANGRPVRYKVENSWGDAVGDKGYFVMTDAWFEEYVYQIVVPKALAPRDLVAIFEGKEKTVFPPWDPMVSGQFVSGFLCETDEISGHPGVTGRPHVDMYESSPFGTTSVCTYNGHHLSHSACSAPLLSMPSEVYGRQSVGYAN